MSPRTTVLFFHTASDSFGGGSQMLLRLLKSIDKDEFEPRVISQYRDELCQRAEEYDISVEIVPFQGILNTYNKGLLSSSPLQMVQIGLRIFQFNVVARHLFEEADIIWCENLRALLTLTPYALVTQTSIIWNIGLGLESDGKVQYLNSLSLKLADRVFIESHNQAKSVFTERQYEKYTRKFTIFHKGIDVDRFNPARVERQHKSKTLVGTAAMLTPRKGLEYFIDAAAEIDARTENDVDFLIAGEISTDEDKAYVQSLQDRIKRKDLDGVVRFLGWEDDMPAYLNSLDVFVLPSLNEGIPGAIREALAMEVPVVATDVGGTSDVVIDGETGYLVPPKDSDAIVDHVLHLLEDEEQAKEMGKRGRTYIRDRFSVESYVENYESFLQEIYSE